MKPKTLSLVFTGKSTGRPCIVCQHHERVTIDDALLSGMSAASVGKMYGIEPRSVQRHAKDHLDAAREARKRAAVNAARSSALRKAREAADAAGQRALGFSGDEQDTAPTTDILPPSGRVELGSIQGLRDQLAQVIKTAQAIREAAEAAGDPRAALAVGKLATEAVSAARALMPPPARQDAPTLNIQIVLDDGSKLLDLDMRPSSAAGGGGDEPTRH